MLACVRFISFYPLHLKKELCIIRASLFVRHPSHSYISRHYHSAAELPDNIATSVASRMNFKLLVPLKNVNKITCKSTANHWVWSGTPGIWWTILVDFAIQDFKPFLLTQRAHSHTYSAVFVVVLAAYSNGLTSNSSPPSMHPALIGALPFFQNEYDHIYHSLFVAQSFSVQTMQILNIQWKLQESFLWLTVVFFWRDT